MSYCLFVTALFITFGDIGRNRNSGTTQLVTKPKVPVKWGAGAGNTINTNGQILRFLPNLESTKIAHDEYSFGV